MVKFDVPPKPSLKKQLLASAIVLLIVAILVAIFAKVIIGFIVFLLSAIAGIGSRFITEEEV